MVEVHSTVLLVHKTDSHILLIKTSDGLWSLPGGKASFGEKYQDQLRKIVSRQLPGIQLVGKPSFFDGIPANQLSTPGRDTLGRVYGSEVSYFFGCGEDIEEVKMVSITDLKRYRLKPVTAKYVEVHLDQNRFWS